MNFKAYCEGLSRLYSAEGFELKLGPGASEAALDRAEAHLGFSLTEELRGAWLHADGAREKCPVFVRPGYLSAFCFLSIGEAVEAREGMRRRSSRYEGYQEPRPRDPRVMQGWFQEGWLPFAGFGSATMLLVEDHAPSPLGRRGQIVAFTHDPDAIEYVAPSFAELLAASIKSIADDPDEFFVGL